MKKILFVTDKFCENSGLSNVFHNIFDTCDESGLFTRDNLFTDELVFGNSHIDVALPARLLANDIDIIVFSYLASTTYMNPSFQIIKYIHRTYPHVPLVFLWWDGVYQINRNQIVELDSYAALHINFDASDIPSRKVFFNGVPQSNRLFYPDTHTHALSFMGRTQGYAERTRYVQFLQHNKVPIYIGGGRTQQNLSAEDYAAVVRGSDINLNFCNTASGLSQCKGRVWEVLASKTMLLEQYNPITATYLEDGKHCVYFHDPDDLVEKISFLLCSSHVVKEITDNAYKLYQEKHQASILWKKVEQLV
jgi:hypothetical protein